MPCATELANGEAAGAVKVGTTGTIGSLMTRELEAIKAAPPQAAGAVPPTAPRLRRQSSPVSVPCGASPRKITLRKSSSNVSSGSSSSSNHGSGRRTDRMSAEEEAAAAAAAFKPTTRRSWTPASSPILRSDGTLVDNRGSKAKKKKKAAAGCQVAGVEVVDVRCGNPMSSRLRRLGFSKLSETFA